MKYVALLVACLVLLQAACGGGGSSAPMDASPAATTAPAATAGPIATPTIAVPQDNRLRIPKLGVDAPITSRAVPRNPSRSEPDDSQKLGDPESPDDVVLYDWTGWTLFGGTAGQGNALIFGSVDSGRLPCKNGTIPAPCAGVFFTLNTLAVNEPVHVFVNGQAFIYTVAARCALPRAAFSKADWIYKAGPKPIATLFTLGGKFDRDAGGYESYIFIRAEMEKGTLDAGCPAGSTELPTRAPASAATATPRPAATVAPTAAFTMTYVRQEQPGTVGNAPADLIPHRFKVTGLPANTPIPNIGPYIKVTPDLPPRRDGLDWDVGAIRFDQGDLVIFVSPGTTPGTYAISIDLPDGRKAQSSFTHR